MSSDDRIDVNPEGLDRRSLSALLTGVVVPRPVAWVSTLDGDGTPNLAPHSVYNIISNQPPIVYFMTSFTRDGQIKDSLRNVRITGEFVINVVKWDHLEPMVLTGCPMPPEEDEFQWAGLETAPSLTVKAPRVKDAPVALECKVTMIMQIGSGHIVLGEVTNFSFGPGVLRPEFEQAEQFLAGCTDPTAIEPVARLGGNDYASLNDVVQVAIPSWATLSEQDGRP